MASDAIKDIITNAANAYGIDPATMLAIASIESGFNPGAYNPSGASGLFQFMPTTASYYGLTDPTDPSMASDAAARMVRDNSRSLTKSLGRAPSAGEIYLAQQQGAGGASALLNNPNANAVDVLAGVYGSRGKAQAAITQNGGTTDMTAGQFAAKWVDKANARAGVPASSLAVSASTAPAKSSDSSVASQPQGAGGTALGTATGNRYRIGDILQGSGGRSFLVTDDGTGHAKFVKQLDPFEIPGVINPIKEASNIDANGHYRTVAGAMIGNMVKQAAPQMVAKAAPAAYAATNNLKNSAVDAATNLGKSIGGMFGGLGSLFGGTSQPSTTSWWNQAFPQTKTGLAALPQVSNPYGQGSWWNQAFPSKGLGALPLSYAPTGGLAALAPSGNIVPKPAVRIAAPAGPVGVAAVANAPVPAPTLNQVVYGQSHDFGPGYRPF